MPLEDITNKNFEKYGLSVPLQSVKGKTVHLKNLDDIALTIVRLFKTLNFTSNFNPNFNTSLPIWDSLSKDLIISVTVPCGYDRLFGILGINLYFSSLVEDITYFNNYPEYFYAFVIDVKGINVYLYLSYRVIDNRIISRRYFNASDLSTTDVSF